MNEKEVEVEAAEEKKEEEKERMEPSNTNRYGEQLRAPKVPLTNEEIQIQQQRRSERKHHTTEDEKQRARRQRAKARRNVYRNEDGSGILVEGKRGHNKMIVVQGTDIAIDSAAISSSGKNAAHNERVAITRRQHRDDEEEEEDEDYDDDEEEERKPPPSNRKQNLILIPQVRTESTKEVVVRVNEEARNLMKLIQDEKSLKESLKENAKEISEKLQDLVSQHPDSLTEEQMAECLQHIEDLHF